MRKIFGFFAVASMAAAANVASAAHNGNIVVKGGAVDTVYSAKHLVVGMAQPGEVFTVNGHTVKAFKTGTWGIELQLKEGNNEIKIEKDGIASAEFNVFYSTALKVPSCKEMAAEKAARLAEAESVKFYPVSIKVKTKENAYLNYGAGKDRLGGAKINYLPKGVEMFADAENETLYRVRLSQNRYAYVPKTHVELSGRMEPSYDFMQDNVVLSKNSTISNVGGYDRISIPLDAKKPFIVKEYPEPHKIVLDIYGVQCNSNWLVHNPGLTSIDNVDVESIDSDITRFTVYLKTKTSWGFSLDYTGNTLNLNIKHVPQNISLKGLVIGIDAGHGGPQSLGAVGLSGLREKDMNLDMAFQLKGMLEKQGAKVVLSRDKDIALTMLERRDCFLANKADIVLSIHCNAGAGPLDPMGASTYYRYNVYKSLAKHLLDNMTTLDGVGNSGLVGNFNFTLSSFTELPCILVETVYISTLAEEEKLADPAFRKDMMERVAKGLTDYIKECRIAEGQAKK